MHTFLSEFQLKRYICNNYEAKSYSITLRSAHDSPVDNETIEELKLPEFADHDRIKKYKKYFRVILKK